MVVALRPKAGRSREYRFPRFEDIRQERGLRIVSAEVQKLPLVTVLVLVDAGASKDARGKEGVAALTASALIEGCRGYSGSELAEKFEQLGTSIESGADWDSAFVKITVLTERFSEAIRLLGTVLTTPVFAEREIERLKAERLAALLQLETEPRGLADEKFSEFVYVESSRYGKPEGGTPESVKGLTRHDVVDFYRKNFLVGSTTIVIAGDIHADPLHREIIEAFGDLREGKGAAESTDTASRSKHRAISVIHKPDAPQSELRVGHVGLPRRHPDFFKVLVMNAVLGGLFGSRINLNLREVHGYTYGASSFFDWRRDAGPFVVSTAVQSEVTVPALGEILSEVDRIRSEPISDAELTLATDYLDGVFPIRYETTSAIASALASLVIYDLPADYYDTYRTNVRSVTTNSVLDAARSHLHADEMQIVVVGDAHLVGDKLSSTGIPDISIHGL